MGCAKSWPQISTVWGILRSCCVEVVRTCLILGVILHLRTLPVNAQSAPADTGSAIALPNSHVHDFHSALNGRDYRLWVSLPAGYMASPAKRYPVLYLLDGSIALPAAATIYRVSHHSSDSLILVGIEYSNPAHMKMYRQLDLTPPPSAHADSGLLGLARERKCCGGAVMTRVIREEIIPLIDRLYRTTDDRGLLGHSYGGLLANYILFADPDLFRRYAITSPSLWWDHSAIFEQEAAWAKAHTTLRKKVFFSIGSLENVTMTYGAKRMAATLQARRYEGLDLTFFELVGAFHTSMTEFSKALDVLYPLKNGIEMYGDSALKEAAHTVVQEYFTDYSRRDATAMRRHLASDSAFQAIVDGRIVLGRDRYAAFMRERFKAVRALTLRVDTLRSNLDANHVTMVASYTRRETAVSGRAAATHGRMYFELAPELVGWRIINMLDSPVPDMPVTTVVRVQANGRPIAGAVVAGFGEAGELAFGRTNSLGIARLQYDWHVSLDGYLQVQARGYAIGMTHLPTQDSVTINLRTAETLDSAAADRYVGTFANSDQSIVWKITRHRLTLMIEHVTAGYQLPAVFLSKTTLLERDGTEIGVTLDASGRAFELRRGSSLLIRK